LIGKDRTKVSQKVWSNGGVSMARQPKKKKGQSPEKFKYGYFRWIKIFIGLDGYIPGSN